MLQHSSQFPFGMFDSNPHQNLPGPFAAGQSHCIIKVYSTRRYQMTPIVVIMGEETYEEAYKGFVKLVRAGSSSELF